MEIEKKRTIVYLLTEIMKSSRLLLDEVAIISITTFNSRLMANDVITIELFWHDIGIEMVMKVVEIVVISPAEWIHRLHSNKLFYLVMMPWKIIIKSFSKCNLLFVWADIFSGHILHSSIKSFSCLSEFQIMLKRHDNNLKYLVHYSILMVIKVKLVNMFLIGFVKLNRHMDFNLLF